MKSQNSRLSLGMKFFLGYLFFLLLEVAFLHLMPGYNEPGAGDALAWLLILVIFPLDFIVAIIFAIVYFIVAGQVSKNKGSKVFSWILLIFTIVMIYRIYDYFRPLGHPAAGFLVPGKNTLPQEYIKDSAHYSKEKYEIAYHNAQNQNSKIEFDEWHHYKGSLCQLNESSASPGSKFNFEGSNGFEVGERWNYRIYYKDMAKDSCLLIQYSDFHPGFKTSQDYIDILQTMVRS
jgi:hypothetical protein